MLGSTIIGLEGHTPANIDAVIEHAVRHETVFHQFMLYTPLPGTPLFAELSAQERMKDESEYDLSDIHGQSLFNYRHPHIRAAGRRNSSYGPFSGTSRSTARAWCGWHGPCWPAGSGTRTIRIRAFAAVSPGKPGCATVYPAVVAAARFTPRQSALRAKMDALLKDLHGEFGLKSRLYTALGGRYAYWKLRHKEKRWRGLDL